MILERLISEIRRKTKITKEYKLKFDRFRLRYDEKMYSLEWGCEWKTDDNIE